MKILLGGIPLGCNNIGDEAIIACVVDIFKRMYPADTQIDVCTADTETAVRLGVGVLPLYGFDDHSLCDFANAVKGYDLFVWTGATGLSDYPVVGLALLETAHRIGVKTALWGVGMDSELNPAFFRLGGRKRFLLKILSGMTMGVVDFVDSYEKRKSDSMRSAIGETLLRCCSAVVVRDPETFAELEKCSYFDAFTGADSAILLESLKQGIVKREDGIRKIGVCVSAQRAMTETENLVSMLDSLLEDDSNRIVFIPMNPVTDLELMRSLREKLSKSDHSFLVEDVSEPGAVQDIAANCDVIISSRLHLLILAGNIGTPVVGIGRGSKLDNYLANFGLTTCGTVYNCDFDKIIQEVKKFLSESGKISFKESAIAVNSSLKARLEEAMVYFTETVAGDHV